MVINMGIKIQTKTGILEGIDKISHWQFLGVPFAQPPIGRLRFRAPEPVKKREGVRKADTFAAMPIQYDGTHMPLYGKEFFNDPKYIREKSEDCLYLNIWCPPKREDHKSAVAIWIHGGAFHHGWASETEIDGEGFCKRDVIYISVEYRMGVFGFLTPRERLEAGEYCGNYGLLDQLMAISWVKENIEYFGGDPENITIFGQSAGAISCQLLCNVSGTKGLFQKAIFQSGAGIGTGLDSDMSLKYGLEFYDRYLKKLGAKTIDELEMADTWVLYQAYLELLDQEENVSLRPCVDGKFIKQPVEKNILEGKMHDLSYMIGANSEDMDDEVGKDTLYKAAENFALLCCDQGRKVPYVYYFSHQLPGSEDGAFHSAELWYVFGTLGRCWRPMTSEDYALSEVMMDAWCNFMKNGEPGIEDWNPYHISGRKEF